MEQHEMATEAYYNNIIEYYQSTENSYRDAWYLEKVQAIHYGYRDDKVKSFPESLERMNEVMMELAAIKKNDKVLDAGCGVGGSSIYLALHKGCSCTGITITPRQVEHAGKYAAEKGVSDLTEFRVMDYCDTTFPDNSFDVVWGCESICYATDKEQFIREASRILKPGGRLVVADGFVSSFSNNDHPVIRNWLNGWQVNYLETPGRFSGFMQASGFNQIAYHDITKYTRQSSRRLLMMYFAASIYGFWKTITFRNRWTKIQKANIKACLYQYKGMRKALWGYGIIVGVKN